MYERRSSLSLGQQSELIKLFVAGATVRTAGELSGVHRNTAVSYLRVLLCNVFGGEGSFLQKAPLSPKLPHLAKTLGMAAAISISTLCG